jgi:hypothetical protein
MAMHPPGKKQLRTVPKGGSVWVRVASVTFSFNCPGEPNNIVTVEDWSVTVRMYRLASFEAIMGYLDQIEVAGTPKKSWRTTQFAGELETR